MQKALPVFEPENAKYGFCAAGLGILLLIAAVCWFLAFARDKKGIPQYGYAVMLPAVLFAGAWNIMDRTDYSSQAVLIWSLVSYGLALFCYFTTKKRFHGVRRLFFGLTALPPMVPAFLAELFVDDGWYLPLLLLAAVMALLLWRLFANRGFKALSIASFAVSLWFVLEATWYGVNAAMFGSYDAHRFSFTVWMLTALWIIALSILAIVIRARLTGFVGGDAVPAVMQAVTPVIAVLLSVVLLTLNAAGKKLIATRALRNFERLTDGNPKFGIHYVEDEKRAEALTRGTNGEFPIKSMLCHSLMLNISNSIENIRKLIHLGNVIHELDVLYTTDPMCGIFSP